jgi:hypothetical protein
VTIYWQAGCGVIWRLQRRFWRACEKGLALRRDGASFLSARLVAALTFATLLSGCASISEKMSEKMADMPVVGLPAGTPERPATPVAFPAVHDMPPKRSAALLNDAQQQEMENELVQARDRQQAAAAPAATAVRRRATPVRGPQTTPAAVPAASGATIY